MTVKRSVVLLTALLCAAALCGCATEPASEKEIIRFAEDEYGAAEFLYSEAVGEDGLKCWFTDGEYGFTYSVSSTLNDINIDGAVFGCTESKSGDFSAAYYGFILAQSSASIEALSRQYGADIRLDDVIYDSTPCADITSDSTADACEAAKQVLALLKSYDTRGYWENIVCRIYDRDGNKLYTCDILHEQPLTPEDENIEFFTEAARTKHPEAQYLRSETRLFSQTGISESDLVHIAGNELPAASSAVTYYIFTADGRVFFLADVYVYSDDHSAMFWHTIFDEIFGG